MLMPDPDKPFDEQKPLKPKRRAPVIEHIAVETPASQAPAHDLPSESLSPQKLASEDVPSEGVSSPDLSIAASEQPAVEATQPGPGPAVPPQEAAASSAAGAMSPDPAAEPEPKPAAEPLRETLTPRPRASVALPVTLGALAGLVFGGVGGALALMFFGGSDGAGAAQIAILDRTQQQLARDQAGLASAAELDKLRQALTKLESDAGQRAAGPGAAFEARVAALEAQAKDAASRVASQAAAPQAAAPPAVDLAPLEQRIAAIDAEVKALAASQARIKALEDSVAAAAQAAAAAATAADPKIAALGQQAAALSQRLDQAASRIEDSRAAPLFSAVQALSQAFHRGAAFSAELAAVETLGAGPEQLVPLRPFAERGAPTPQKLQEAFAPLAGRLAGDASQSGAWGYVSRFVTIRPTADSASDAPAAIVGSIETALRRGDAAAALANWSRLPEPARAASADWGKAAGDRVAAEKALAALSSAAASALRK